MPNPHDLALTILTGSCAVGALLMADAADTAFRSMPAKRHYRISPLIQRSRVPRWAHPAALHCVSLGFLGGMATSGAILIGAFP